MIHFRVNTRNTVERLFDATQGRLWTEFVLDGASGATLLSFQSGFGDGSYPVDGLYSSEGLAAVEVEFIGPAQDEVLKAFPILRY